MSVKTHKVIKYSISTSKYNIVEKPNSGYCYIDTDTGLPTVYHGNEDMFPVEMRKQIEDFLYG